MMTPEDPTPVRESIGEVLCELRETYEPDPASYLSHPSDSVRAWPEPSKDNANSTATSNVVSMSPRTSTAGSSTTRDSRARRMRR